MRSIGKTEEGSTGTTGKGSTRKREEESTGRIGEGSPGSTAMGSIRKTGKGCYWPTEEAQGER